MVMENRKGIEEEVEWQPDSEISYVSKTYKKRVGCGSLYITIVYRKDEPTKIKQCILDGSTKNMLCLSSNSALADMTTFALRHARYPKTEYQSIIKNLKGSRCYKYSPNEEHNFSCSDVFGKVLEKELLK